MYEVSDMLAIRHLDHRLFQIVASLVRVLTSHNFCPILIVRYPPLLIDLLPINKGG